MVASRLIYFFSLIFLLFTACKKEVSPFREGSFSLVKKFPRTFPLEGEKLNLEIPGVNDLFVADTFLLGYHAVIGEKFYTVYSTGSFQYLGKCLGRGKGPQEFLSLVYPDLYEKENDTLWLWQADYVKDELFLLDLTQSLAEGRTVLGPRTYKTIYSYPLCYPLSHTLFEAFLPQEKNLVFTQYDGSKKEEILRKELLKDYPPEIMAHLKYLNIKVKPDRQKMVLSLACMGLLHFCTPAYDSCLTVGVYEEPEDPVTFLKTEGKDRPHTFYQGVRVNNRYVAALYLYPPDQPGGSVTRREFQFLDWKGNPLFRCPITENILAFALDPDRCIIYALTDTEEIYRYKAPINSGL